MKKIESMELICSITTRESERPEYSSNGGDYNCWNSLYFVEYTEYDEYSEESEKHNGFFIKEHTSCDMVDDSFETTFTDPYKGWGRIMKVSYEEGLEKIKNKNIFNEGLK